MSVNKKYFWFKLKEDFFNSPEIILLESQKDGYLYSNILLKMYCLSLKNNGKLMLNEVIPLNSEMIATLTRMPVGVVELAIKQFLQLKLIEIIDDNTLYMNQIGLLTGISSSEGDRKKKARINNKIKSIGVGADICPPDLDLDLELELDIEKDKDKEIKKEIAKKIDFFAEYKFSEDLKLILIDFVEHRKNIKKPIKTQNTFDLLIKKLNKLAKKEEEQIEILENSIINGYSGIFPIKNNFENKKELEKKEQINKNLEYYLED